MKILLNGKIEEIKKGQKLIGVLEDRNIKPAVVAVELNGEAIEKKDYDKLEIRDGDQLEFVYFMGGGLL
ncbi:MAG: sulfur carrier protein ThiS [Candidatus Saganbacteria bacterium]|nr:sulfur carrier protein ThiS [Candidatus Saganbacteria bacterium]